MRRANINDARDVRSMIKDKAFFEQVPGVPRNAGFRRRLAKNIAPDSVAHISNHQAADDSSHAVPDKHELLVTGKHLIDFVELLSKKSGRIRIRITARITKDP